MSKCQCCGFEYQPDEGIFYESVCPKCLWEQDTVAENEYSDMNDATLIQYREINGVSV